jgi:DNA polymerase I-like protein with 3'-5' exonuclease and polymerase domains
MSKEAVTIGFAEYLAENVQTVISELPWMKNKHMTLCKSLGELREFIELSIQKGICALDLETTGLNTRLDKYGHPYIKIVGVSLAYDVINALYVPINHREGVEFNLPESEVMNEIRRLCANCVIIAHNAKYDFQVLKNEGIIIDDFERFEDTLILAKLYDAGQKEIGLKHLSDKFLKQPMIEFTQITGGTKQFTLVSPDICYIYAASDAICTFGLYEFFRIQQTVIDQRGVYNLEKRLVPVVMQMEANLVLIDVEYLKKEKIRITEKLKEIEKEVHTLAGESFNVASTQQLGKILFNKLKYRYPEKEMTAKGQYKTDGSTLEKIADEYPIVKKLISFRELEKSLGTYVENLINNCDENNCVKFSFNQNGTDTGRFSSPGGKGIQEDGYSAVNVQSIPANYDETVPDIRRAILARSGKKIVAMDFSGEELRVAANLSLEKKWVDEFLYGSADLHTATGKAIFRKEEITKAERQAAKTTNFLVLYGGGPRGLAEQAKLSEKEAKRILTAFFEGLPQLDKWIKKERRIAKAKKRAVTAFKRIRPLDMFYDSGDRALEAHADRCATNFLVQGCLKSTELVLTNKGYIGIAEVKERKESGEEFKVWTGTSWEDFDVINRGKWQLATIELINGMTLNCDTRHEVLTVGKNEYEFKKFEDLDENSQICVSVPTLLNYGEWPKTHKKSLAISSHEDWIDFAYFLGFITGDGSVHSPDDSLSKFPKYSTMTDLLRDFGYDSNQKRIPKKIFSTPKEMRVAFLKGVFDKDGLKKEQDRFGFYSSNKVLLKDIQLLAWTLGCGSRISPKSSAYLLSWSTMEAISSLLSLRCLSRQKYRGSDMILPKFMHEEVLNRLKQKKPYTPAEIALLSRLRKMKNVSTQSMVQFLRSKQCDLPEMYYYFKLKSKKIHVEEEETYTLSVHSPLHRFDSAGIISKNTCADIMKTVMVRVSNWIKANHLEDEIKILITMHDELVFEMTTENIGKYIPPINDIMCLRDILQGPVLQWPVPLTVDAEYGDNWHVTNDFFKENPQLCNVTAPIEFHVSTHVAPTFDIEQPKGGSEPAPVVDPGQVLPEAETGSIPPGEPPPVEEPKVRAEGDSSPAVLSVKGEDNSEEMIYTVRKTTKSTVRRFNDILVFLSDEISDSKYVSPKKMLRLQSKNGDSLLVSNVKVRADACLALIEYFGL